MVLNLTDQVLLATWISVGIYHGKMFDLDLCVIIAVTGIVWNASTSCEVP